MGIRNLTTIHEIVANLKEQKHISLDMMKINLKDAKTYQLLSLGNTLGVFQLESSGITSLLQKIQPNKFEDISVVLALYRHRLCSILIHILKEKGSFKSCISTSFIRAYFKRNLWYHDLSGTSYADSPSDWWI